MEDLAKFLILFYCLVCRFAFEIMGVVGAYFMFPKFWAVMTTVAFVFWAVCSFFLKALAD